jgi:N-acyl-D-aspartate/D-glutamate deacylase
LITRYARDEGVLTVEEAIHIQTGKIADFFRMRDRGVLQPGLRADIAVFALNEIECRPKHKVWDLPGEGVAGGWRWTRDPAPVRLTLVNGVPIFEDGTPTDARPGVMLGLHGPVRQGAPRAQSA